MRPLVIDASAALAHVVGEPDAARVEEILRDRDDLLVPWIFWTEIINVLGRRHRWQGSRVLEAVYDLEQLRLRTEPPSRPTMLRVIDAVEAHGLTAYDAEYLVLAEDADAELLTGDAALAQVAGSRAILIGPSRRLAEEPAPYPGRKAVDVPDWPRWPGAAAYLEDLRREVRSDLEKLRMTSG